MLLEFVRFLVALESPTTYIRRWCKTPAAPSSVDHYRSVATNSCGPVAGYGARVNTR